MTFPAITTERLILRPWTADDIDTLHQVWTDPDVRRYLWDDKIIDRALVAEVVESSIGGELGYRVIEVADSAAGFVGFRFIDETRDVELLYGMLPSYWGKGLCTEAARAALDYVRRQHPVIYARTDPPNTRSEALMKRLGMRHVSTTETLITYAL